MPSIIRQVIDNSCKEIRVGDISTKRDFNYVSDTVEAFLSLINLESKLVEYGVAYNAGSGLAVSIEEALNTITDITNSKKTIISDESRMRPKNSEVKHLIACSKKLNIATYWKSKVSLKNGLKMTIDWWEERYKDNKVRKSSNFSF